MRDLIDEVGRDAVRFFLVSRKADSEFTFDIDLARSQSEENPVYYVQYAHARVASVLRQAGIALGDAPRGARRRRPLAADEPLRGSAAAAARRLPGGARGGRARSRAAPGHRLPARTWPPISTVTIMPSGSWSTTRRVQRARLALAVAAGQVLRNGLAVLGIAAPEQM